MRLLPDVDQGRELPCALLASRLKCPRCGSRSSAAADTRQHSRGTAFTVGLQMGIKRMDASLVAGVEPVYSDRGLRR